MARHLTAGRGQARSFDSRKREATGKIGFFEEIRGIENAVFSREWESERRRGHLTATRGQGAATDQKIKEKK